jgi:twinkle protein
MQLLSNRTISAGKRILKCLDIKDQIIKDVYKLKDSNKVKLKTLPVLSNYMCGFRENELSIFSGPSGVGKTTLLSQISLDYALQGINTLWCSFEIKNSRLALTMMEQMSQKPIISSDDIDNSMLNDSINNLNKLPLFLLDCQGRYDHDEFFDLLEESSEVHEIKHIIIDNLQFMLSNSWRGNFDKFDLFERTITALRTLCNTYPFHVSLVVHPRKEDDNVPLGLSSISGTAKATQEADNVFILQRIDGNSFLDVKKNRFGGKLGRIPIEFNQQTKEIREILS